MKIFNWVHRKLNQKDGLYDRYRKKNEVIINKNESIWDKQLLLQDDSMAPPMLGNGGILTIGTFGFDPLMKDQLSSGPDVEDYEIIQVSEHEKWEIVKGSDPEEKNPSMYANNEQEAPKENVITGIPVATTDEDEANKSSKKERITLADLFSADQLSDEEKVRLPDLHDVTKKTSKLPQVKNGVSFAKKIIPRVREDSRRILKLQKLMTRAVKKKVHPDMESKNNRNNRVIAAASNMIDRTHLTSESISLLEILETTA